MTLALYLILVALVATYLKVSRIMSLLEKFNGLNGHVGQLLDLAATQAGTLAVQAITLGNQTDVIQALNASNESFIAENDVLNKRIADLEAAINDVPAVEQGVTDLDARVTAALPPAA